MQQTISQYQVTLNGSGMYTQQTAMVDSPELAWNWINERLKEEEFSPQQRNAWKRKFAGKSQGNLEYPAGSIYFEINKISLPLPQGKVLVDISELEDIYLQAMLTLQNISLGVDDYAHPRRISNAIAKMLNAEQENCECGTIWGSLILVPGKDPYCPICDKKYPI